MFIDTHCHLRDEYKDGIDAVIMRANNAGVAVMICATADPEDIEPSLNIAQTHNNIQKTR